MPSHFFHLPTKLFIRWLLKFKSTIMHTCKHCFVSFKQTVIVNNLKEIHFHCITIFHVFTLIISHHAFSTVIVKAERTPRSERKRRDSFGMYDGYESCSEESTSSSSSEDSDDEVVPSIPASLPIIKNNGQVYTYPDGKAGMGESWRGICPLSHTHIHTIFFPSSFLQSFRNCSVCLTSSRSHISFPAATCEMCGMVGVRDAFYSKTKRFCSVSCSRSYSSNSKKASILARLQVSVLLWCISFSLLIWF